MDEQLKTIALEGAERALPRILGLLEKLCALDSCSGHEPGNRQVIELLRPVLEELGAQVEEIYEPGLGTHLAARVLPEGKPAGKLLLMAHLDTVFPVGSAAQHPFRIDGDWAWGLGVGDCKSGVLISLFGALILKEAGMLPPWELTYLFNCDEEIGSGSGQKLFAREAKNADCALVFEGGREQNGADAFVTAKICLYTAAQNARALAVNDARLREGCNHAVVKKFVQGGVGFLKIHAADVKLGFEIIGNFTFHLSGIGA